ncbi:hypothetical protein GW915_07965 [bacterium]|nr:hypothetical protein [bacterium]
MNNKNPKLEAYLTKIDKALGSIAVSEKAEIITELKSHILSELSRNPNQNLDKTLASLGEAEHVANRYLLERGLSPSKASKHQAIKWAAFGLVGTLSVFAVLAMFLFTQLTPIIEVNEAEGRVRILGGLIDISDHTSSNSSTKKVDRSLQEREISGTASLSGKNQNINIPFANAILALNNSKDDKLSWTCKIEQDSKVKNFSLKEKNNTYNLDMSQVEGANCNIELPRDMKLSIHGSNGNIQIQKPAFDVDLKIKNGQVSIHPREDLDYSYSLDVTNGEVDGNFISSTNEKAKTIKVSILNGQIVNSKESD